MKYLVDLFYSLFDFLSSSFKQVIKFLQKLPDFLNFLISCLTVIPPLYSSVILVAIAILVIYLVLGR